MNRRPTRPSGAGSPSVTPPPARRAGRRCRSTTTPAALDLDHPPAGWNVDRRCQPLPGEPPGEPVHGRQLRDRGAADPRLRVRRPLDRARVLRPRPHRSRAATCCSSCGRSAWCASTSGSACAPSTTSTARSTAGGARVRLELPHARGPRRARADGLGGVEVDRHRARSQFRVHAVSRPAPIANPVVRIGFWLLRGHERAAFLDSTDRRMRELTALGLDREHGGERIRAARPAHGAPAARRRRYARRAGAQYRAVRPVKLKARCPAVSDLPVPQPAADRRGHRAVARATGRRRPRRRRGVRRGPAGHGPIATDPGATGAKLAPRVPTRHSTPPHRVRSARTAASSTSARCAATRR